ncbi:hypothetical protein HZH66_010163 [Vespula vulgaris]|uniref:Uncharacterized protein n=1 Tax=Vespula vulgaris TaxID=7454 RepID=A0A834JP92_VESVU|nr:hypothetical protein HZH66_010163 [Vespula vulgaris]
MLKEIILIDVPAMVTEITKPRSEVPSGKRDYGNEKNSKSEKEKKQSVREEEEEDCEGNHDDNPRRHPIKRLVEEGWGSLLRCAWDKWVVQH